MSVAFSTFYDPVRFLIQDFDPDVPLIQDCVIDSALRYVVNSGAIRGYAVGSDNVSIVPYQSSSCGRGYQWGDWDNYAYQFGYGSASFLYGNYYNLWFDQAFNFLINYQPPPCHPTDNDLTPMGNQEGWKRLCAECALWFVSGMVQQNFGTRSMRETVAQPKDLLYKLEFYLDSIQNRGKMSGRPMPLPLVAIGIRSFYSGLWFGGYGLAFSYWGVDLATY
jgi:hypothetical protein